MLLIVMVICVYLVISMNIEWYEYVYMLLNAEFMKCELYMDM
jgi:hypothetical protein